MIVEFKEKRVWVVVGSVHNKEKFAYKIYNFLKSKGYQVYAVDPSGNDIDGQKSYKTLTDLPEKPDALDMVINPMKGMAFVEEAKSLKIDHLWFQPGAGNQEIVNKANEYGMKVIDDRCVMVEF